MDGGAGGRFDGVGSRESTGSISVEYTRLASAGRLETDGAPGRVLSIVVGSGCDCALRGAAMPVTVLLPLRGHLRVCDGEGTRTLLRNELFVSEAGRRLDAIGSIDALWVAIVAPDEVWQQLLRLPSKLSIPAPALMPATHSADRATLRAVMQLLRAARRPMPEPAQAISAAERLAACLLDLQSGYDALVDRCPGRTRAQRRGVLVRLQRACRCMEADGGPGLDLATLARKAHYSMHHFVRTFNKVYGTTPYARLIDRRLGRARRLVSDTSLSIGEVASAAGFESRSAFARAFKRRFGISAHSIRKRTSRERQEAGDARIARHPRSFPPPIVRMPRFGHHSAA